MNRLFEILGRAMVKRVTKHKAAQVSAMAPDMAALAATLQPGDVLLIEGGAKISSAIKYLTQSTWSHAAFYVGPQGAQGGEIAGEEAPSLVEVEVDTGCILSKLSKYAGYNVRICRAVGLVEEDRARLVGFMLSKIGLQYDLKNIVDLVRWLFPLPLVPQRWRRGMIALGSGDPTRAICSTLIAQAFDSIHYPILPTVQRLRDCGNANRQTLREIMHIRHYSLYTPRDFDVSPYFDVVKPTIERGFDYKRVVWAKETGLPL